MARAKGGARKGGRKKTAAGAAEPVKYGPLAQWIGFNLRMAQEATFQAFSHLSKDIGENPGRFAALTIIGRNPGISQTALSRASGRDKSSMTPALEDLVRRGLVARRRTDNDRRAYRLSLTTEGERTLARLNKCAQKHERNLDRIIGLRDREKFLQILKRIAAEIG